MRRLAIVAMLVGGTAAARGTVKPRPEASRGPPRAAIGGGRLVVLDDDGFSWYALADLAQAAGTRAIGGGPAAIAAGPDGTVHVAGLTERCTLAPGAAPVCSKQVTAAPPMALTWMWVDGARVWVVEGNQASAGEDTLPIARGADVVLGVGGAALVRARGELSLGGATRRVDPRGPVAVTASHAWVAGEKKIAAYRLTGLAPGPSIAVSSRVIGLAGHGDRLVGLVADGTQLSLVLWDEHGGERSRRPVPPGVGVGPLTLVVAADGRHAVVLGPRGRVGFELD